MLYLASQFVWFLLAAFGLGLAMGWISRGGGKPRLWSAAWNVVATLWTIGAVASWFQFLNGALATWVETALLFVAVYWLGCACAGLSRRQAPAAETANAPALPVVENEAALPGRRPVGLAAPHRGGADDLKLIKGVGRQNEGRLHGLGIWHFEQIAAWSSGNVEWVGGYLAFPGRIEREDWVGQARILAAGGETEFAERARAGLVETSRDDGSSGQSNVEAQADGAVGAGGPKP
jgi:predicted flap endonuclease-1-like 5' DNA nuclease